MLHRDRPPTPSLGRPAALMGTDLQQPGQVLVAYVAAEPKEEEREDPLSLRSCMDSGCAPVGTSGEAGNSPPSPRSPSLAG